MITPVRRPISLFTGLLLASAATWVPGGPAVAADPEGRKRNPAPELDGAEAWVNTPQPLRISELKGKVVLLDFWTYG